MIICPDCKHSINEHGKSCRHNDIINPANWVPCECKLSAETIAAQAVAEARREAFQRMILLLRKSVDELIAARSAQEQSDALQEKMKAEWDNLPEIEV